MTALLAPQPAIAVRRPRLLLTWFWLEILLVASCAAFAVIGTRAKDVPLLWGIGIGVGLLVLGSIGAPAADRRVVALSGIVMLLIAIPINRLTGATVVIVTVLVSILLLAALALVAGRAPAPAGAALVIALVVLPLAVTIFSPDKAALFRFAPYAAAFLPGYWLFGQAGHAERHRILRVVLALAVFEGLLSMAEPFIGRPQFWGPAQLNSLGQPKTLMNPLLTHFARSQGTLGHPLPLGVLLALGLAILIRREGMSLTAKLVVGMPLVGGLLFSGSRNSLLIAIIVLAYFAAARATALRGIVVTAVLVLGGGLAVATGVLTANVESDFEASGSYTHRLGALGAIGRLFTDQTTWQLMIGNGWASTARLFAEGLMQTDGFGAVDNEFVLILAQAGLVGLLLLAGLLLYAVVRATPSYRPMLLAVGATLFVFDVLIWPSAAVLFGMVLAGCIARPAVDTGDLSAPEPVA